MKTKPTEIAINASTRRHSAFERSSVNDASRTVSLAFSSEQPYDRSWGREILDHRESSIDLGRLKAGAPLLIDHDNSIRSQIGVVETVTLGADKVGRAIVRFGSTALALGMTQRSLTEFFGIFQARP